MSWNLTKSSYSKAHQHLQITLTDHPLTHAEFKETHLGPIKNPLSSRSASTSTLKNAESSESTASSTPRVSTPTQETAPTSIAPSTPGAVVGAGTTANADALVSPPPAPLKPGILIVTLHEGKSFSLPDSQQQPFNPANSGSAAGSYAGSLRPATSSSRGPGAGASVAGSLARPQSTGGPGAGAAGGSAINAAPTNHGRYATRYLPYVLLDFDKLQIFVDAVSGTPENPIWPGGSTQYKFDVSRVTDLAVQLYLRNPHARPGAGRSDDIFLGACRVKPRFEEVAPFVEDLKASRKDREKSAAAFAESQRGLGQVGDEWNRLALGSGAIKIGVKFVENRERALKIEDFELLKVVGKGSFGKVMQVL